jgi:hypothetical protein
MRKGSDVLSKVAHGDGEAPDSCSRSCAGGTARNDAEGVRGREARVRGRWISRPARARAAAYTAADDARAATARHRREMGMVAMCARAQMGRRHEVRSRRKRNESESLNPTNSRLPTRMHSGTPGTGYTAMLLAMAAKLANLLRICLRNSSCFRLCSTSTLPACRPCLRRDRTR